MACPYLKFVTVYTSKCNANNRNVPGEYQKAYCRKGASGYKACPYYQKRGPGF